MQPKIVGTELRLDWVALLETLSDEDRDEIVKAMAWDKRLVDILIEYLATDYAGEHYNSDVYRMRLALFQHPDMPEKFRQTVGSLLSTVSYLRRRIEMMEKLHQKWLAEGWLPKISLERVDYHSLPEQKVLDFLALVDKIA